MAGLTGQKVTVTRAQRVIVVEDDAERAPVKVTPAVEVTEGMKTKVTLGGKVQPVTVTKRVTQKGKITERAKRVMMEVVLAVKMTEKVILTIKVTVSMNSCL